MSQTHRRTRGYALLLTLVLLAIAAIALAQVARQSTDEALSAREQTQSLQRRWAITTCRATLLPRAQGLLASAAPNDDEGGDAAALLGLPDSIRQTAPGELRTDCELAGISYELVFTDEQAKYNPTAMAQLRLGDQALVRDFMVRAAVRDLSGPDERSKERDTVAAHLRPMLSFDLNGEPVEDALRQSQPIGVYASYGQLFDAAPPERLVGSAQRPGAASQVTCWGDGRINLNLAPASVIQRVLGPVLGSEGVRQLLIARSESPGVGSEKWLSSVTACTDTQRALAGAMLTEQSNAQGLWVIAHGQRRSWHTLSVRVYTPLNVLEMQREAERSTADPDDLQQLPPLPDPIQRYDYQW